MIMASTSGGTVENTSAPFRLEVPVEVLATCASCQHGVNLKINGQVYGTDGTAADVTVLTENTDGNICFTFADNSAQDLKRLLRTAWKCEIKSVTSNADSLTPAATSSNNVGDCSGVEKTVKTRKRRSTSTPCKTAKRQTTRSRRKSESIKEVPLPLEDDSPSDTQESEHPEINLPHSVADDENPGSEGGSESDISKISGNTNKSSNTTGCTKAVVKLTKTNVQNKSSVPLKKRKIRVPQKKKKKPEDPPKELEVAAWKNMVSNYQYCRVCDSDITAPIRAHLTTVHSIDWATYQQVTYVIERDIQRRYVRKNTELNNSAIDPKRLTYSRFKALKILKGWREAHANMSASNIGAPRVIGELQKQSIVISNKVFKQCPHCEKIFTRQINLDGHVRMIHESSEKSELERRRSMPREPGSNTKYGHLYETNMELCIQLGIITSTHDQTRTTACVICKKIMVGSTSKSRLIKHLTETHLVALDKYQKLLEETMPAARQELMNEIMEEERQLKNTKKKSRYGHELMIQCPSCYQCYKSYQNLFAHLRTLHEKDADYQEVMLKVEEECSMHWKPNIKCREELEVSCPYCNVKRVGRSIVKHIRIAHSMEPDYSSTLKQAEAKYAKAMKDRETKRKMRVEQEQRLRGDKYPCKFCRKEFNCRTTCQRHAKHMCELNMNRVKAYFCPCSRRFTSRTLMMAHKAKCPIKNQTNQCHLCGKIYKTRAGLYTHKKVAHTDGQYKHRCPVCDKQFYQKHHFNRHIACHTEDRKCQCELCGKQYKTDDAVKKHQLAVHLNKYPYYCDKCGHGMAKKKYLKAHKCGNVRRVQVLDIDTKVFKLTSKRETPDELSETAATDAHCDASEVDKALVAMVSEPAESVIEEQPASVSAEFGVSRESSVSQDAEVVYMPVSMVPSIMAGVPASFPRIVDTYIETTGQQDSTLYSTVPGASYHYYPALYDGTVDYSVKPEANKQE